MGFLAAAGVMAAGSIASGILGASSAKKQAKAQKEQAKMQREATREEAQFTLATTKERTALELSQTKEQVGIGSQQAKDKLDLDYTQKVTSANLQVSQQSGELELQARQAEGAASRTAFQIEATVYQNRSLSAIKQAQQAMQAALTEGKARAAAGASGVAMEGSAAAVIRQGSVLAELDRLDGAYQDEMSNRGLLIERGMALAKATETRLAVEYDKANLRDTLGLEKFQAAQSRDVGISQIYQNSEFSIRASEDAAKVTVSQAQKAADLQIKYAEIAAKFATREARSQLKDTLTNIAIGTVTNVAGAGINAKTNRDLYGPQPLY